MFGCELSHDRAYKFPAKQQENLDIRVLARRRSLPKKLENTEYIIAIERATKLVHKLPEVRVSSHQKQCGIQLGIDVLPRRSASRFCLEVNGIPPLKLTITVIAGPSMFVCSQKLLERTGIRERFDEDGLTLYDSYTI